MAKAALEMAVLDAELRAAGVSFAAYLGGVADVVTPGVAFGIMSSVDELLDWVSEYLEAGYRRVKLKICPGWDLVPVAAVRDRFGENLMLQVDANSAYRGRHRSPRRARPVLPATHRATLRGRRSRSATRS